MSEQKKIRFSLNNIFKKFRSHNVGPISFDIFEEEILGLSGKTGCGKTTMSRILMRLMKFDSGTLYYQGDPISAVPICEFRQKNQIMFQNHLLSVNLLLKIGKIITEPLIIAKFSEIEIRERICTLLELFELPVSIMQKYPDELSGGELQRIVFLRTLVLKPEFIILDEPFSNIDRNMSLRLIESIKKIREEFKMGILIITHSAEFAECFSDRLLEFSKLLQSGSL